MSFVRDPVYGCELVTSRLDRDGYAYQGKSRAHIVAWEAAHGPRPLEPDGTLYQIDHACMRRNCRSLIHLEAVTVQENMLRKIWRYRAKKTHCKEGHDMKLNAMITPEGGRVCRVCRDGHE